MVACKLCCEFMASLGNIPNNIRFTRKPSLLKREHLEKAQIEIHKGFWWITCVGVTWLGFGGVATNCSYKESLSFTKQSLISLLNCYKTRLFASNFSSGCSESCLFHSWMTNTLISFPLQLNEGLHQEMSYTCDYMYKIVYS